LSGLAWGVGDFSGGLISRYSSVLTAMATTQLAGLAGTLVLLVASAEPLPGITSLAYAALASSVGVVGLGCFYYALSRGSMGVIAPLAALIGAGLPVLIAIVGGEQVSAARLAGIVIALGAVVLISLPGGERTSGERRRLSIDLGELPLVLLSGLGFAGFFIFIDRATAGGETWWPMTVVRLVGCSLVLGATAVAILSADGPSVADRVVHVLGLRRLRGRSLAGWSLLAVFIVAGLGDLGGNAFFVLAKHADAFSVAVILSSLYPVITTILARMVLHERLRRLQLLGVALATISVPLLR
jgi:drug/metabolite transporter (DMT)-like permease